MVDDEYHKEDDNATDVPQQLKVFTLNSAYEQIGGFGLLQFLALVSLIIIRNMG